MMGIEYIKKCKKCGKLYDIGINYGTCPECRNKKKEFENGNKRINR